MSKVKRDDKKEGLLVGYGILQGQKGKSMS